MHEEKGRLREMLLDRRSAMGREASDIAAEAISRRLLDVPEIAGARTVLAFWPMLSRAEVDIRPVVRGLAGQGKTVGLPVLRPSDPSRTLAFGPYAGDGDLVAGPFGTLQPSDSSRIDPATADVVIVPALGATRDGFRLGYGGGYYDRFLATASAFSIIPLFACCLLDSLPVEAHDRQVNAIATEVGEIRIAPPA